MELWGLAHGVSRRTRHKGTASVQTYGERLACVPGSQPLPLP